tara:strand:- start:19363 stop:21861 length:2499 start_codon:yes stop_codon:yes gene_type:complete
MSYTFPQQRLSYSAKKKNDFQWGKDVLDALQLYGTQGQSAQGQDQESRKKVNYDLFNGILNQKDFEYVCKPYGIDGVGELPAEMRHYDIISPKLRVLFGEEIKRPFNYKVVATNPEAITERETAQADMLRDYMQQNIQAKIQQAMMEAGINPEGGPQDSADPEAMQQQQMQMQQIQQQMTPPQIEEYMKRDYQDQREIMGNQILGYLKKEQKLREKFIKGWKHGLISSEEMYYVGIVNGEPVVNTVNPLYFTHDKDPDIDYIEDGQWAKYSMRMTAGSVVDTFGEYLTPAQIKDLYSDSTVSGTSHPLGSETFSYESNQLFSESFQTDWDPSGTRDSSSQSYIQVIHCEWRSLKKLGFLTFTDDDFSEQETIVDETYTLNKDAGDIKIKWEWIPEIWEGTKIGDDVYCNIRPKPNQSKDIDNLYSCKLGYVGSTYNNLNAYPVSLIDRMKPYQYLYNIMMYRLELDLAADKGKKFLADINQIPSSMGIDMEKWLYYFDALGIAFINPKEEGKRGDQNHFNQWQSIDLSMAQTIQQKIGLLEYLEAQCSEVSGITKQREGQVGPNELVGNTEQAVVQSSAITEELFYTHNSIKGRVLEALLDTAKVAWGDGESKKIQYILDDMTVHLLTIDPLHLPESSFGVFVSDSSKDRELYLTMKQLAHAAIQNQTAELSDVIKMLSTDSTAEIKTLLEKSEDTRKSREQEMQKGQQEAQQQATQAQMQIESEKLKFKKYEVDQDNETKVTVAEISAFKGKEDQDINGNQIPDQLEIEKLKATIQTNDKKVELENRKLDIKEKEITLKDGQTDKKLREDRKNKEADRKSKERQAKKKESK